MPKPKPKRHSTPDRPPSPTELRALSNAALTLELSHMPDAGDPVRIAWKVDGEVPIRIAEQIKAAILGSEHERAYTWLRGHLPKPDKVIDREPNAALAEIEAIRAAAEATADFLQLNTATAAKAHVARLRKMREAIKRVLDDSRLSDSSRKELSVRLCGLRWLDAITAKGSLREQIFLFHLFEQTKFGLTSDAVAAMFTPLLVALTRSASEESTARNVRRYFAAFERHFARLREEVDASRARAIG